MIMCEKQYKCLEEAVQHFESRLYYGEMGFPLMFSLHLIEDDQSPPRALCYRISLMPHGSKNG
jgi:hypothetical protein